MARSQLEEKVWFTLGPLALARFSIVRSCPYLEGNLFPLEKSDED